MKDCLGFISKNKAYLLPLFLLVVGLFIGDANMLFAETATVVPPPAEGTATPGSEGLNTQLEGQTASVTNLQNSGDPSDLEAEQIDEQIAKFRTDFFVVDTIARRAIPKSMKTNYVVKHFNIDAQRLMVETNAALQENSASDQAILPLATADKKVFQKYQTVLVSGVPGYDESGQNATPNRDLALYIIGNAIDGSPIAVAINGKKAATDSESTYVPAIPSGTALIGMSNAGSESQLFCPPFFASPSPKDVYMQRKMLNIKVTEYFENVAKKVAWDKQQIAEQALWEFRRRCEISYLFGIKGKVLLDDPSFSNRGAEYVYFQEGIYWQIEKFFEYDENAFTFNDLLGITKAKFAGNNGSRTAFFGAGKDLVESILKIDYTKIKELRVNTDTKWGIKFTAFESSFGTLNFVHLPILDEVGKSKEGLVLDLDYLNRYVMKDEAKREVDMATQGEEAKRDITIQIDSLALRGSSHLIVRPAV